MRICFLENTKKYKLNLHKMGNEYNYNNIKLKILVLIFIIE